MIRYLDFELTLTSRGNQYEVAATSPFGGKGRATFELDQIMKKVALPELVLPANGGASSNNDPPTSRGERKDVLQANFDPPDQNYGRDLFYKLFKKDVLQVFTKCLTKLDEDEQLGVRITLNFNLKQYADESGSLDEEDSFNESEYLFSMPWELVKQDGGFYSLDSKTPLIRNLEVTTDTNTSLQFEDTINVLILAANPEDMAHLNLSAEIKKIEDKIEAALSNAQNKGKFNYDVIYNAKKSHLKTYLMEEQKYDIIHFLGHGIFNEEKNSGALVFEDENQQSQLCYSGNIESWVSRNKKLKLFFLNACETALTGRGQNAAQDAKRIYEPHSGIAATLIKAGVPAVIAMQRPINDSAAIAFSEAFYNKLVDYHMAGTDISIESCVTEARKQVHEKEENRQETDNSQWAIPVLFLRTPPQMLSVATDPAEKTDTPVVNNPLSGLKSKNVFLYYHKNDRKKDSDGVNRISPLRNMLKKFKLDVNLPNFRIDQDDEEELRKDIRENLSSCVGYILVWGSGDRAWEKRFEEEVENLEAKNVEFLAKYKCVLPAEGEDEDDILDKEDIMEDLDVINCMTDGFMPDEDDFNRFLEELSQE